MPSPKKGFLWRENEESMFCSFHPLADKTNNKHLPKPFFKDIRKSLYPARDKDIEQTSLELMIQLESELQQLLLSNHLWQMF